MSSLFEQNPGFVKTLLEDSGYSTGILDGLYAYYKDLGGTGSLEDMVYTKLGEAGYTGSLPDRWRSAINDNTLGGNPYELILALNASDTDPLTALSGTDATWTRTSSAIVPDDTGEFINHPASYPVIEDAEWDGSDFITPTGTTEETVDGMTSYTPPYAVLCEPAATNLLAPSTPTVSTILIFPAGGATVSDGNPETPLSTLTSVKMFDSIPNQIHGTYLTLAGVTASSEYRIGMAIKPNGREYIRMSLNSGGNGTGTYALFHLIGDGTIETDATVYGGGVAVANSARIVKLSDGFYYCSVAGQAPAATSYLSIETYLDATTRTYAGDGISGCFLTFPQLTAGSTATSPILGTATRNASYGGLTGSELGTTIKFSFTCKDNVGREQWLLGDGTAGFYLDTSGFVNFTDGTDTFTATTAYTRDTPMTVSLVEWAALDIDGATEASGTAITPTWGTVQIGADGAGANVLNGSVYLIRSV